MSSFDVISLVSLSLKKLLGSKMHPIGKDKDVPVSFKHPSEAKSIPTVNLFLYKINKHPTMNNADWFPDSSNPTQIMPPPLSIVLYYLLTPFADTSETDSGIATFELLGDAMRVFNENPVIPDDCLEKGLENLIEKISIIQCNTDLDEITKVWNTSTSPYVISIPYEISVVQIDQSSTPKREIAKRAKAFSFLPMTAQYAQPVIEKIGPLSGPIGTEITISGSNFGNWPRIVTLSGKTLQTLNTDISDEVKVTIPSDTKQGLYELRVAISNISTKTVFFEVTNE